MRFPSAPPEIQLSGVLPEKRLFSLKLYQTGVPFSPVAVDNLAQSVDGGHSRKRLHPGRPPPGPGCPPPPYNGGTPPNPRRATARPTLNFSRSPKTARSWASGMDNRKRLPTPATVAPVPGTPSCWMTEAAGARCAKARQGRSPGVGGVPPHAGERLRRGPEAGGCLYLAPLGA